MSKRHLGLALIGLGLALVAAGMIGWLASGGDTPGAAPTSTEPPQVALEPEPTTTTTTATSTTAPPPSTTTTSGATTTTFDSSEAIENFVVSFAEAIDRGDVGLLFQTLHPTVTELFDPADCRAFIEDEILLLEGYRLTGPVEGPDTETIAGTPVGMYRGPVAFTFRGQEFASEAGFAIEGGQVRWFTQCGQ